MTDTPRLCVYCEGQRPDFDCGFCEDGVPLESREELERGWREVTVRRDDGSTTVYEVRRPVVENGDTQ